MRHVLQDRDADAKLLKTLLAAAIVPSPARPDDGAALLNRLLKAAPKVLRQLRKSTLFEAIHVLDLECAHSDFLAWLLDPLGPLHDNWLLKTILQHVAPEQPWDGNATVEREFELDNGRLDILITWSSSSFKLIIENKVWSSEGDQQVHRYLEGADIATPQDGRLVYLSPHGKPPRSIGSDERVHAVGYKQLANWIDEGLKEEKEPKERGRVFAEEFRDCIRRLIRIRYEMTKPPLSESTRIYLRSAKRLAEIKEHALGESWEFLQWIYSETESRFKKVNPDMITERGKYGALFRLPTWKRGEVPFGVSIGMNFDPSKRLVAEHNGGPYVGIACNDLNASCNREECQSITDKLLPMLRKVWPHAKDLSDPAYDSPLWREVPIPKDGDMDHWAEDTLKLLEELATKLTPVLKRAAIELAAPKGK